MPEKTDALDLNNIKDEVIKHALEEKPSECCGLAIIRKGKLLYKRCKNITKGNQFTIDPLDYAEAEDLGEIVGVCHSHINTSVNPSEADLVGIEKSKIPWLIVNPDTLQSSITYPNGFELPLVGRKFKHGVIDCYTLVQDYYKKLDINLVDFFREEEWWLKGKDLYRDNFKEAGFIKVGGSDFKDFNKHDAILMQVGSSVPNHAAVYIDDNIILQHCQGRLSSKDIYSGYWRKATVLVLRHKDLI